MVVGTCAMFGKTGSILLDGLMDVVAGENGIVAEDDGVIGRSTMGKSTYADFNLSTEM